MVTGYWMERSDGCGKCFCGTTVDEVLATLRAELEVDFKEGRQDSIITLSPFEVSQDEIDAMPEFDGW